MGVAAWSGSGSMLGQKGRTRALGEGEGGGGCRERRDRRIYYFSCLILNGYRAPLFIVLGDLVLKPSNFMKRALINLDCYHNK
jgi:hypothetical protein